jgi:hypothetical protein
MGARIENLSAILLAVGLGLLLCLFLGRARWKFRARVFVPLVVGVAAFGIAMFRELGAGATGVPPTPATAVLSKEAAAEPDVSTEYDIVEPARPFVIYDRSSVVYSLSRDSDAWPPVPLKPTMRAVGQLFAYDRGQDRWR